MLRKERSILLLFFLIFTSDLLSQSFVFRPHKFGTNLFAGGIDNPRFQFVDIDSDNDSDLFLFDRDEQLCFYRNISDSFILESQQTFGITVGSWFHFVDIDGDGDQDCFTNGDFSEVRLFTNIGSPLIPNFQLSISILIDTSGNELFSERFSVPTFADIDADGDYDFFTGSSSGSITFYKNVGTAAKAKFAFVTNEFDGIKIIGAGVALSKVMHGASGIEFFDVDSNGTLDLFWGDYFNPSMYFLKNIGTKQNAHYALIDSTYPNEEIVSTLGFNIPQHVDIDGDGLIDLMVGSVFPNEGYNNFWFYKNIGSNAEPVYSLQTKNFIPMFDAGVRSSIALADFDGDSDEDLCLASGGGVIAIYKNIGTTVVPNFSLTPVFTININAFYLTVTAGDLNGDSKPDLLVGDFSGGIRYFQNITASNVISFTKTPFPLDGVNVGNSSAPCIADVDTDGMMDVLIGTSGGKLCFYKNTGTNIAPSYTFISNSFNSIDVGNDAIPFLTDVDMNGNSDLLIGNSDGKIFHYRYNAVTQKYDSLTAFFGGINVKINAAPALTDIDGDGDVDLFVGNGKGGIFFYENTTLNTVKKENTSIPTAVILNRNYPNPFNPKTKISFYLPRHSFAELAIFDILGRKVETVIANHLQLGEHSVSWDATKFPSGTYFYRLSVLSNDASSVTITRPMLLIK